MRRIALSVLAVALMTLATQVAAQCTAGPFDLSSIGTQTLNVNQKNLNNNGVISPYQWQINFCTKQPTPAACNAAGAASYVNQLDPASDDCFQQFSQYMNTGWSQRYGGWWNAIMTTSQNTFNVTLLCDQTQTLTADGTFNAHSSNGQQYTWDARIKTKYVCGSTTEAPPGPPGPNPPGPPSGPSTPAAPSTNSPQENNGEEGAATGAIIFVVLVFTIPFVYVVGFVLYNRFKLGKSGFDLLPHPEFWKDFPVLCLDGCKFVKNKFMQCIGKGDGTGTYGGNTEGSYSQVA